MSNYTSSILSEKAVKFINKADTTGEFPNKVIIIGRDTFAKLLPILANKEIQEVLEIIPITEENIDTPTRGSLLFAEMIGLNTDYVTEMYKRYLKTYLR